KAGLGVVREEGAERLRIPVLRLRCRPWRVDGHGRGHELQSGGDLQNVVDRVFGNGQLLHLVDVRERNDLSVEEEPGKARLVGREGLRLRRPDQSVQLRLAGAAELRAELGDAAVTKLEVDDPPTRPVARLED